MTTSAKTVMERARRAFGLRAPQLLAGLTSGTSRAAALAFDLEVLRAPSGGWEDLHVTAPGRPLDLPPMILSDLGHPEGAARDALEASLFDAGALSVIAIFLAEATVGAEAGHDPERGLLLGALVAAASARLLDGAVEPAVTSARFAAAWTTHADDLDLVGRPRVGWTLGESALSDETLTALGRRHAPLGAIVAQAIEACGRRDLLVTLAPTVDQILGLHQLVRDLDSVHRDLGRGWWSLPVARLAAAVGVSPASDGTPPEGSVRLATMITRALPTLADEALARIDGIVAKLAHAGLEGVATITEGLRGPLLEVGRHYGPPAGGPVSVPPPLAFRVDARPRREQALDALRAALDDDPELREAWFTRRDDGAPSLDRISGPATVVENRVRAGERRPADVDALFRLAGEASSLATDARATLAGLAPHGSDPEGARRQTAQRLVRAVTDDQRCAGVQARFALGLLAWPEPPDEAIVLARAALDRVEAAGADAFAVHDPLYGALLVLELIAALRAREDRAAPAAQAWALAFAARWRCRAEASPLAAAWLWLITALPAARRLRDPGVHQILLCSQRAAGVWDADSFPREPTRGSRRPASRLVTTSFVYRALVEAEGVR